MTIFSLLDKRDKEVYFDEDPTEVTFVTGMAKKLLNPGLHIRTDDWGYFYRSFDTWIDDKSGFWNDYEVMIPITCTAGVTGIMWLILSIIELVKFCSSKWNIATCVYKDVSANDDSNWWRACYV